MRAWLLHKVEEYYGKIEEYYNNIVRPCSELFAYDFTKERLNIINKVIKKIRSKVI